MLNTTFLTCSYVQSPLGLGEIAPNFGWILESDKRNVLQTAYRLQVALDPDFGALLWDSGAVSADQSVNVPCLGFVPQSATEYFWRVQVADNHGDVSPWSETAHFEMGLLSECDWKAVFISPDTNHEDSRAYYLRKIFHLPSPAVKARLYATALGMYELFLNGKRVGEDLLTPGWTEYKSRLQHQTYDVTDLLHKGENELRIHLGSGWYKCDLLGGRKYGLETAALCQLNASLMDGKSTLLVTDESWEYTESPVLFSELYHGETYDARITPNGWRPVRTVIFDKSIIIPQDGLPVRRQETLPVQELIVTPKGETVLDFGQNLVGFVHFRVHGNAGDKALLRHAEILDAAGNFYTENLRSARETVEYILCGDGEEVFEPHFSFQGFRYVCVDAWPGNVDLADFEAVVIHSDMRCVGDFHCSEPLLEQLHHNILWGMKGNFVDVCTDCPQRDERLGWTGDAQVFVQMATDLMDVRAFFRKWLRDMRAAQFPNGGIPVVIPDVLSNSQHTLVEGQECFMRDSAGWSDAAVIIPWTLYKAYGDIGILREHYPMMKNWVEFVRATGTEETLWDIGFQFGDWLALDAHEGSYFGATPNDLVATAFYAYSTELLSKTAEVLGLAEDAAIYRDLRRRIGKTFEEHYFMSDGTLISQTQTAQILSLAFGLVPEKYRTDIVNTLLALIQENGGHLTTGFLGTPFLCHVLADNGELDTAYGLLLQKDYPSWLYQVLKGATTIWEHWDGIKPDGSMWSADMNSFNHYAFGAIGDFLYRIVAGIDVDECQPGYKHILFHPCPGGGLHSVSASLETPYGKAAIAWTITGNILYVDVLTPHNTTATLILPSQREIQVGSGSYSFEEAIQ